MTTPAPTPAASAPVVQPKSNKDQRPRGGPASRGGKYYQRGGAKNVVKDTTEQDQESTPRDNRRGEYL